jgi:hypothetical protein
MSEVAQRTPTPPGVLVPVPGPARTHSGPGPRPAEGPERRKACNCGTCRYLVVLADAGTFHRAADGLFIAQPTLSQQIRRLEEIVGTPLAPALAAAIVDSIGCRSQSRMKAEWTLGS